MRPMAGLDVVEGAAAQLRLAARLHHGHGPHSQWHVLSAIASTLIWCTGRGGNSSNRGAPTSGHGPGCGAVHARALDCACSDGTTLLHDPWTARAVSGREAPARLWGPSGESPARLPGGRLQAVAPGASSSRRSYLPQPVTPPVPPGMLARTRTQGRPAEKRETSVSPDAATAYARLAPRACPCNPAGEDGRRSRVVCARSARSQLAGAGNCLVAEALVRQH